jgi:hypothetical protein
MKIRHYFILASEISWWLLGIVTWVLFGMGGWRNQGWIGLLLGLAFGGISILSTVGLILSVYEINDSLRILTRVSRRKEN